MKYWFNYQINYWLSTNLITELNTDRTMNSFVKGHQLNNYQLYY